MPALVVRRPKPRPIFVSDALSLLSEGQQQAIRSGYNRQRFKLSLARLSLGKPVRPSRIPVIVRGAARAVLEKPHEQPPLWKPDKNVVSSAGRELSSKLDPLNRKLLKWLPRHQRILFPTGARTNFFAVLGAGPSVFNVPGPAVRVAVRPAFSRRKNPGVAETLSGPRDETARAVANSVGFATIKFHRIGGTGKPVLVVWDVRERALSTLKRFNKYKKWEMQLLDYLEEIARRAGASKIAVVSPEHARQMDIEAHQPPTRATYLEKRFASRSNADYYENLAAKLAKTGYHYRELGLGLEDKRTDALFLVKELE